MSVTKDISGLDPAIQKRIKVERRIVRRVVKDLLDAGFALSVDNGGDDVEIRKSKNAAAVLETMMETDEETLMAHKDGKVKVVYFVYGNDGNDVIADYSVSLEPLLAPINEWAEALPVFVD